MEKKLAASKRRRVVAEVEAVQLILPILAFLQASGVPLESAERAFKTSWLKALRVKSSVSISNLTNAHVYAEIVGTWTKNGKYVDRLGNPRLLSLTGKNGFSSLVKKCSSELKPSDALQVLIKFGNVQRTKATHIRLVHPFFHVRSADSLAFEPSARFLSDASATVRHLLGKPRARMSSPSLFWRTADTSNLPNSAVPSYIAFAKSRSLVFLQEIDEWLQAHTTANPKAGRRRVGLGLFSICGRGKPL